MEIMNEMDRDFVYQLIIIISGFILAETLVRKVIEGSNGLIDWWVLPLLAIMFLVLAMEIKHKVKKSGVYYISYIIFPVLVFYVYLVHKGSISSIDYLLLTLITVGSYNVLLWWKIIKRQI